MIYFIQDAAAHLIKIGYTEGDSEGRLKALQTGNPSGLVLLATVPGDKAEERRLHELFAHARDRGEWFRPVPEVLKYLLAVQIPSGSTPSDRLDLSGKVRPTGLLASERRWPLTFYFAGKVRKHCWRERLLGEHVVYPDDCGSAVCGGPPPDEIGTWPILERVIFEEHHYAGPYFVSCDHGCFHGDDTHGVNADRNYGDHNSLNNSHLVVEACLNAIQRADVVFAWIDQLDCYGTITELGYAAALRKPIWACGPRSFRDMWFPLELADNLYYSHMFNWSRPEAALREFLEHYRCLCELVFPNANGKVAP